MPYKSVIVCNSAGELPGLVYESSLAIVNGGELSFYVANGGSWVKKEVGATIGSIYPLDSVYSTVSEKDPADILGFGKWELVDKKPVFMWKRIE